MKELSIREKAKAYDEAMERAKAYQGLRSEMEIIFPELKDEDERIRKDIIYHIQNCDDTIDEVTEKRMLAWLERQGEHANFRNKIQIGDKVTRNEDGVLVNLSQLKRIAKPAENKGKHNMGISEATKQELEDNLNKALEKETPESCNEFLEKQGENSVCKVKIGETYKCIASPRYTCFRKGDTYHVKYNFVAELINICSSCFVLLEKQGEQKAKFHDVCDKCVRQPTCQSDCFLQQDEQKPWTEEDEKQARQIERIVHNDGCTQKLQKQIADWLKSLKDRYTWKPSERQKEALLWCVVHLGGADKQTLGELLEELNRL